MQRPQTKTQPNLITRLERVSPIGVGALLLISLLIECALPDDVWPRLKNAKTLAVQTSARVVVVLTTLLLARMWRLQKVGQDQHEGQISAPSIRRRTVAR